MKLTIILILIIPFIFSMPSYDDLLVVIKQGEGESQEIVDYFQLKRGIPAVNMAVINRDVNAKPSRLIYLTIWQQMG